jgi:nucleotide-binding universal stress UspA family protein
MSDGPILLCYDGSDHAAAAIAAATGVVASRVAVVLTAWEPISTWEPYDPGGVFSAGVARLGSHSLGLDEVAADIAREKLNRGVELARAAGFDAHGRLARGKAWHAICDLADELDAAAIVLGARGLSRVRSMLLGSVSAAVTVHARRPVLVIPAAESGDDQASVQHEDARQHEEAGQREESGQGDEF